MDQKESILIVDDQPSVLDVLRKGLRSDYDIRVWIRTSKNASSEERGDE